VIFARDAGHPLIPAEERVCNDFSIDGQGRFMIITGANMAGKSTFLRTAGLAMVLAMAGAPVCASEFRFRPMDVFSGMRTSDSLARHESYFYAELRRLKQLVDTIAGGNPVFVILDEILKGTNSADKQKGSMAIMEQLLGMGATGIIATHDLALTSLGQKYPGRISNKCFEIEIETDRIHFDYQLRDGVTRKMNALLLMRQMGLFSDQKLRQFTENS
jgi:DNA mismatch repair ATPase MutS